jgi:biotin carboxyl carrier protein
MSKLWWQIVFIILLGTSAIAVTSKPSNLSLSNNSQSTSVTPKRLKITLSINDPNDLKVREGDRVSKGQILSDRDLERKRLNRQKMAVLISIAKIEQTTMAKVSPSIPLLPLPPVSFNEEETAVSMAELKFSQSQRVLQAALINDPFMSARAQIEQVRSLVDQSKQLVDNQQRKLDTISDLTNLPPEMVKHEAEKLKLRQSEFDKSQAEFSFRQAELNQAQSGRKEAIASMQNNIELSRSELELAQARLRSARERRQRDEYEHSITAARRSEEENQAAIAASNQKLEREFKLSQLQETVSTIEEKLNGIAQVTAPYSGIVKRVKTQRQADNTISVIVTLQPDIVSSGATK